MNVCALEWVSLRVCVCVCKLLVPWPWHSIEWQCQCKMDMDGRETCVFELIRTKYTAIAARYETE